MFLLLVVLCCIVSINGQVPPEEQHPAPEPYSFAYTSPNDDGTFNAREETGDADGRVTGFYTLLGADGQQRRVEYIADENGFRANVITNEIGTESQNPADVQFISSAPTAAELNAQWEAANAGRPRPASGPVPRPIGGPGIVGPAIGPIPRAPIAGPGIVGPGPVGPVPRPPVGIRAPAGAAQRPGLIAAPIGPIGGGIAGSQGLASVGAGPIGGPIGGPQIGSFGPLPGPVGPQPGVVGIGGIRVGGGPIGGPIGGGLVRGQGINPLGGGIGLIGGGAGVAPNGFGGQVNYGLIPIPFGAGANLQQLQGIRGFGIPLGNGQNLQNLQGFQGFQGFQGLRGPVGNVPYGYGNVLLVPVGAGLQGLSGVSNVGAAPQQPIVAESNRNEGYGRKI